MAIDVVVPPLGESTSGAKLSSWLKKAGDAVKAGETIAEIETDKTIVEVVAPADGTLQAIQVPVGGGDLVDGRVIAVIADRGSARAGGGSASRDQALSGTRPTSDTRDTRATRGGRVPPSSHSREADPASTINVGRVPPSPRSGEADPATAIAATPLAQRMAAVLEIDLAAIPGTGASGKISTADIERFVGRVPPSAGSREADPAPPAGAYEERPLSPMRKVTAARMAQAKQTIPHFYLSAECYVDALIDAQTRLNSAFAPAHTGEQTKFTLTDFVIRAVALAMREVPDANATWIEGGVRVYATVDVAVAVNTPRGLITPIVRDAASKPIDQIAREFRALTARARDGALAPPEYTGGTVTISNLGMYGVESLFAILNPPQSCIIGIGAVEEKPVVRSGQIAIGSVMTCTLSADHRVIDGATGAVLLRALKQSLEDPARIVGE